MTRLVDYFVVVGYDFDKQRGSTSTGKVVQRFPETDWSDVPFIEEVGVFCQPQGWRITSHQPSPSFYTAVLTDFVGRRNYCSCLTFYEEAAVQPVRHMDEADMDALDDSDMPFVDFSGGSQCTMFVPKCLVILSRFFYLETFRECLSVIFTVLVDEMDFKLEKLIGNLLALIKIRPTSPPSSMTFTLGAGDEHTIKMRDNSQSIPVTGTCVQRLFEDLGIHAVITLFSAVMSEHKILFHSKSYSRLQDACHALTSLMYPFKYTHTYIPLLPSYLFEVLNAPTPFVIGVHSGLKNEVSDILDVIIVDLDGGYIAVPDCVHVPTLDEASSADLLSLLCSVIRPQLACADDAFPACQPSPSPVHVMDKEIRAIFIRFFALLLSGYRTCLQSVRIHPKPFITFHKAVFLGRRNLIDNEFAVRILDSMFFSSLIQERGPPFRPCDLFDELYANLDRMLHEEIENPELVLVHIKDIANKLLLNETVDEETELLNKWKPSCSLGARSFPLLDGQIISGIIESERIREEMEGTGEEEVRVSPKFVAIGPTSSMITDVNSPITNSARRLEVMKNCIQCIFENRITDAKKTFPAVLRTLKNNTARLALAQELSHYVSGAKAILGHDQFDLVVRLMNCALQQDCDALGNSAAGLSGYEDVNGVASAIIPLSMAFCRKLYTHVIQFAYTCVQGHAIWNNQSFWESSFYQNVSKDISALYSGKHIPVGHLAVVAQQMQLLYEGKIADSVVSENEKNEIKTLFSQVVHFSNTIIALKIPLDVGTMDKTARHSLNNAGEGHSDTTSNAAGNAGHESWRDERDEREPRDDESGFEEDKSGSQGRGAKNEIQENVIKFITRFQDKVCSEGELSEEDIRRLHSLIPGLVQMQADTLDQVYKESRKLPPVSKPKIMQPDLLPGEEVTISGLRVFLIPDGRDENYAPRNASNCAPGVGPVLLPAEGAVFLTNYRIIFRGRPCDPFYAESSVVRSFPIATLTKEKRISIPSNHFIAAIDHMINEGLQLRSNAFQLLTIAFDDEVSPDSIEMFKKMVNKARSPADIFTLFAFTSQVTTATQYKYLNQQKQKDKGSTFKNVGKKTLRRAAQMTGFQNKSKKSHKYLVQSIQSGGQRKLSPTDSFDENSLDNVSFTSESRSVATMPPSQLTSPLHLSASGSLKEKDTRELQKLCDLLYVKDYQRLRLGSAKDLVPNQPRPHPKMHPMPSDAFRITCVNSTYSVVSSYPSFLVVPRIISDESVKKFSRGYRQGRFPVVTWKHKKGGLLLRGSSFHGKGVISLLRGHTNHTGSQAVSDSTLSVEQEKYLKTVIALTPSHFIRPRDPVTRLRGLPEDDSARKHSYSNTISVAMNTLRTSGGKGTIGSFGKSVSRHIQRLSHNQGQKDAHEMRVTPSSPEKYSHHNKTSLYIIGERNQIRGAKSDHFPNCEFVPVEVHEAKNVKQSFKKLLRACCPSLPSNDSDVSFHKEIRASEWYQQLQTIMQLSATVVDIIDEEECSVMICLEDGWDLVPQIASVAQLCLDPFYRTFRGFRTLIEKEWLSFGHRFSHRSNHTAATLTSGFAPIFLQFLDIVHQVMNQFALSFEFNNYFLKFLAYHYVSCRFRSFLLDSECERAELGWLIEDLKRPDDQTNDLEFDDDTVSSISGPSFSAPLPDKFNYIGTSFWTYAEAAWTKSSLFYNFLYEPTNEADEKVLRPSCNLSTLTVWDYYCEETLAHGFSYDPELVKMEKQRREEVEATEQSSTQRKRSRKVCNALSECVPDAQPSSLAVLLDQVRKLEQVVGYNCNPTWASIWNKIEIPLLSTTGLARNAQTESFESLARLGGLSGCQAMSSLNQKRLASINGRNRFANLVEAGGNQFVYSHRPHRFERSAFTKPTNCDACRNVLWGFAKTDMKCSDCNFSCHNKCADQASNNCSGFGASKKMPLVTEPPGKIPPPVPPPPVISQNGHQPHMTSNSIPEESATLTRSDTFFDNFSHSGTVADNITFQGYLNKKGALLKSWKQRYFILDSIKHQLRYYDSDDPACRGWIDLADVTGVQGTGGTTFELLTRKRGYSFSAKTIGEAQEWVEKIQACLQ